MHCLFHSYFDLCFSHTFFATLLLSTVIAFRMARLWWSSRSIVVVAIVKTNSMQTFQSNRKPWINMEIRNIRCFSLLFLVSYFVYVITRTIGGKNPLNRIRPNVATRNECVFLCMFYINCCVFAVADSLCIQCIYISFGLLSVSKWLMNITSRIHHSGTLAYVCTVFGFIQIIQTFISI